MARLKGKVVAVTGAARGIGAAACRTLAAEGASVVVTARDLAKASALRDAIAAEGGICEALACDVSRESADPSSAEALVAAVDARFGRLDALVNNAATVEPIGSIADGDPETWARAVEINLIGAYRAARAALRLMARAGGGTIVNLSSGAAFRPMEGWSAYCASKAGLAMLTRSIDHEYAASGVVAVGLSPGIVDTGMQGAIRASGINPVSRIPREALADPAEPARAVAFLCGEEGRAYAGLEVDVRDAAFRAAIGLAPLS